MRQISENLHDHPVTVLPPGPRDTRLESSWKMKVPMMVPVDTGEIVGHFHTNEDGTEGAKNESDNS